MSKEHRYQPGDQVVVRRDLTVRKRYYMEDRTVSDIANSQMIVLRGQTVTIAMIGSENKYAIKEDGWIWTDEMFEGLADSPIDLDDLV